MHRTRNAFINRQARLLPADLARRLAATRRASPPAVTAPPSAALASPDAPRA
ncbi:hypothetical protein ACILG0_01240 [Pseudomonadota bacterium AL_CKDN230030165-1A_HGKHYDSX7]